MPPPKIEGLEFDTACGQFRIEYRVAPIKDEDRNRWEYWIQFKWLDPHDAGNRATPEYQMHLDLFEEDILAEDAEAKLQAALRLWIEGAPYGNDPRLRFTTDSLALQPRPDANLD